MIDAIWNPIDKAMFKPISRREQPPSYLKRDQSKLPVEEEGLLEGAAEAGLLVPEARAGAAMLAGAVYAAAPVQVSPIAVPLVDLPGREPQEGERVREGHRVGE